MGFVGSGGALAYHGAWCAWLPVGGWELVGSKYYEAVQSLWFVGRVGPGYFFCLVSYWDVL